MDESIEAKIRKGFESQSFMSLIRAELITVNAGYVEIRFPFNKNLLQQNGFVHGAALAGIADNACGYACISLAGADENMLTLEYKINFLRPALGEYFIAKAKVIKNGARVKIVTCEVLNNEGKEIAFMTASLIMASAG
jgi:uncharacterized protein (TIGR00369 family)